MVVTIDDYKEALGEKANGLSDMEIVRLSILSERLARALFDAWERDLKNKLTHPQARALEHMAVK